MKLIVGTDSTWSLRVWISAQLTQQVVDVEVIDLTQDGCKTELEEKSPSGLVPVLVDREVRIHDSLAICEYLNERSGGALYPKDTAERAVARSLCCEMLSGFMALRTECPFTLDEPEVGELSLQAQNELDRVAHIFSRAQGAFMFDKPTVVDAFYSILAFRLKSYGIVFEGLAGQYQTSLLNWSILTNAIDQAYAWRDGFKST